MDRRIFAFTLLILAAVLLAGCSQVFEAGISGKVVTEEGTGSAPVSDVNVFAYTDEGLRDSDLEKFIAGTITRPSDGAGYVASTTTNANGEFVVNKIVWETKKSKFGKTADVNKLYLIFYHPDYDVASDEATVISGSTNQSNVYMSLEGNKDYTTMNITVYDVATHTPMADSCTLAYKVEGKESFDSTIVAGGASAIRISYKKGTTPDVDFVLTSPGTAWSMCDKDGNVISSKVLEDVGRGTLSINLYMKNFEMTLPAFSGDIDGTINEQGTVEGVDNLPIRLAYINADEEEVFFQEIDDDASLKTFAQTITVNTNIKYKHGVFEGVGSSDNHMIVINRENYPNMGFVIDDEIGSWDDITGKTMTIRLHMYFGTDKHIVINYSRRTEPDLKHVKVETTP